MIRTKPASFAIGIVCAALPVAASGQVALVENFDTAGSSANWSVHTHGEAEAIFGFDYSALGVPAAPNGTGTTGLYMRTMWDAAGAGGVSVSSIGQNFTGDFILRFDSWGNFAGGGDLSQGASGSTQNNGAGIGTAGSSVQISGRDIDGPTLDSVYFSTAADGWGVDYGAYTPAGQVTEADVYAAGSTNDTSVYYHVLGGKQAPAAQLALSAGQAGTTRPGAPGMAWREVEIAKIGDTVTWTIDGLLIATIANYSTLGTGGGNIFFNFYDKYLGNTNDPDGMQFGLVDNVSVEVIPEPSTYAMLAGLGFLGFAVWRRSRKQTAA